MIHLVNKKKQELESKVEQLEVLADVYSESDWDKYLSIQDQLKALNKELLDIYNTENDEWLKAHETQEDTEYKF